MTRQADERWIPEETFGDRIRRVRRQLRLSQGAFAAHIGEGDKTVGAWEAGTRAPRSAVTVAKRIELAYGVPATWLLGLDGGGLPPAPDDGQGFGVPLRTPHLTDLGAVA